MVKRGIIRSLSLVVIIVFFLATGSVFASVVLDGSTQLSGPTGTQWTLDGNFTSPESLFIIGGSSGPRNRLLVTNGQTFTASAGMDIGYASSSNGHNHSLSISTGGHAIVKGNLEVGNASISQYSNSNNIEVTGFGARLDVEGKLDLSRGYNATNGWLTIADGGLVVVDSDKNDSDGVMDFELYSHITYGHQWLNLNGGTLAIWGDQTTNFVADQSNILASIRVWDDTVGEFMPIADFYDYWQAPAVNDYFQYLSVEFIENSEMAASLGVSNEFVGFTVVNQVPEPATLSLLAVGGLALMHRRRK